MALAFNNTGDYAKAVYGEQQHAGPSGSIAMASPSAPVAMKGGQRKNKSQKQRKNKSQKQGGQRKNKSHKQRKNKNQRK